MRTSAVAATTLISLLIAVPALAQGEDDCPPGSWFCEEPDVEPGEGPDEVEEGQPEPPEVIVVPSKRSKKPPPIVVYRPKEKGDPTVVVVERGVAEPPPPPKKRWKALWGLNLHLEGALMGSDGRNDVEDVSDDAGMGGFGLGLRYRPKPHFAFEVGMDFLAGNDYQGHRRTESAVLFNGIVFFNPKDKFQLYGLGGFGFSGAEVSREVAYSDGSISTEDVAYSYFGLQMGLGAELMLGKRTALSADVIGFIRGRTDSLAEEEYEFYDEDTGRGTNTSGGGLARVGITFYW